MHIGSLSGQRAKACFNLFCAADSGAHTCVGSGFLASCAAEVHASMVLCLHQDCAPTYRHCLAASYFLVLQHVSHRLHTKRVQSSSHVRVRVRILTTVPADISTRAIGPRQGWMRPLIKPLYVL
jgi:hypothetical protein